MKGETSEQLPEFEIDQHISLVNSIISTASRMLTIILQLDDGITTGTSAMNRWNNSENVWDTNGFLIHQTFKFHWTWF